MKHNWYFPNIYFVHYNGSFINLTTIKYFENIFSSLNDNILMGFFSFMPEPLQHAATAVAGLFVGEGWHLTLGALFVIIVVFLPGGLMEGLSRIGKLFRRGGGGDGKKDAAAKFATPAE